MKELIEKIKVQQPGWKSNLAIVMLVLVGWAKWFDGLGVGSHLPMFAPEHLPGMIMALGPIVWAWLLNPPRRKE